MVVTTKDPFLHSLFVQPALKAAFSFGSRNVMLFLRDRVETRKQLGFGKIPYAH